MATSQDLGTPKCSAEERAWLLVYQKRLTGLYLTEAFNKQFPPARSHRVVSRHVTCIRNCTDVVRLQLQNLAEQFPWYERPPQEGEAGYAAMKKLQKQEEARERIKEKKRDLEGAADGGEHNARADTDDDGTPTHTGRAPREAEAARTTLAGEAQLFRETIES